ncbi:MAG TPA: hypothetical protein VK854_12490 [Woeseiaceae bacterium]|nr:hypothetical protein [Woeseiaceae bacterium]
MKKHLAQYLNEIVSITIMLLMTIALIAGQAAPVSLGADDGAERRSYQAVRVTGDE